jgi:hypothetical protein
LRALRTRKLRASAGRIIHAILRVVPITTDMGLPAASAETDAPMSGLFAAAERLRAVRRATRRFTVLWAMEREMLGRLRRGIERELHATITSPRGADDDDDHDDAPEHPSSIGSDREGAD